MKFNLLGHYFNNQFLSPSEKSIKKIDLYSPADLDLLLWRMPIDYENVDDIIESAYKGMKVWKSTSLPARIEILNRYKDELTKRKNEMAESISWETGKPLWESLTEVSAMIAKVDVTIKDSLPRIQELIYENIMPNVRGRVGYRPIGPMFIIGPFNFPCHLANGQIVNSLISGNSIIFKPSEKTAYSGQLLIECLANAGFPEGVVNLVQGDGEIASRIIEDKRIRGVHFTGSKDTGLKILKSTYQDLGKIVSLELGGKNTSILCQDAHLEYSLPELIKACFLTTGQRCTSTAIIAIHENIKDQFIEKFHETAKKLVIDHPIDFKEKPFMGPLIDQAAVDNYLLFMGMAKREGIEEIMRGKVLEREKRGHYVTPSIHLSGSFSNPGHFLQSEIFGPNCTFIPFKELEEAIEIANGNEYGLASSIFTQSEEIFLKASSEIEVGVFNWNKTTVGASSRLPFGGVKNSGNFRPAAVSTIDSCVYSTSRLEVKEISDEMIDKEFI